MLTKYIEQQLHKAKYELLDDGKYYGEIPGIEGVWASSKTLEKCRAELQEVLEEWANFLAQDGWKISQTRICRPLFRR